MSGSLERCPTYEEIPVAVPKRKTSRSNTRHRRSAWKATAADLVPIRVGGREVSVPRRLVKAYQRGLIKF
ncbi:50S ribosomal protein L32 [soil metagenome]